MPMKRHTAGIAARLALDRRPFGFRCQQNGFDALDQIHEGLPLAPADSHWSGRTAMLVRASAWRYGERGMRRRGNSASGREPEKRGGAQPRRWTPPSFVRRCGACQCAAAFSAPMPVCERTYCASKAARSRLAAADLSVIEKNQQHRNASGMLKIAGEV